MINLIKKSVVLGVALMVFGPLSAGAMTTAELQAQLNALIAQLAQMQAQQANASGAVETADADCVFNRNLYVGVSGTDVKCLQNYLVEEGFLKVTPTGYFGSSTKAAVARWQSEHDISASGYFGAVSRSTYSALAANKPDVPTSEEAAPITRPTPPVYCAQVMRQCADGSYVGYKPGTCEYYSCPATGQPPQPAKPWIVVTYPRGGETFYPGVATNISWNSANLPYGATIDIGLTDAYGQKGSYNDIASGVPNTGMYTWYISSAQANYNGRIVVSVSGNSSIRGISSGDIYWNKPATNSNPSPVAAWVSANSAFSNPTYTAGSTNVKLASFVAYAPTASGIKISTINLDKDYSPGADLQNLRIVASGSQFGSTKATISDHDQVMMFSAYYPVVVAAGGSVVFDVYGDIKSSSENGTHPSLIDFISWSAVGVNGASVNTPSEVAGQTVTIGSVEGSGASIIRAVGFNPSVTAGTTNQKIAQFNIYAPANQSMSVSSITLSKANDAGFDLQNMRVMVVASQSDGQFGAARATIGDAESAITFSGSTSVFIPQNTSVGFVVYADVLATTTAGTRYSPIDIVGWTAVGNSSGSAVAFPGSFEGPDVYVAAATTSSMSLMTSSSGSVGNSVIMGSQGNDVLRIRLSADGTGDLTVTDITVTDSITGGASGIPSFQNLSLYDGNTRIAGPLTMTMSGASQGTATFTLSSPLLISRYSYKELILMADVATFSSGGAVSGSVHTFSIASGGVRAIGPNNLSANISGTATGRPITVYRTRLSISSLPGSGAGSTDLATLNLSAESPYQAQLNSLKLTFSGNALAGISSFDVRLIDASTGIDLVGSSSATCTPSSNLCTVTFTPGYIISAGTTKALRIRSSIGDFTGSSSGNNLSIYINGTGDLVWGDGSNANITLDPTIVPFNIATITYR